MGFNVSRIVEIQISNKTQNITLKKPRTHFFSGHSVNVPQPSVPPGSSSSWKFTNRTMFWGCNGVLAYEADSFTLAIYFSNPVDYNRFSLETGLELSVDKVHKRDLESTYDRLVRTARDCSDSFAFPCVIIKEWQNEAQLSAGPVTVTATMVRGRNAVIKVVVEEREDSGSGARRETPCRARHTQENPEPGRPSGEPSGEPRNCKDGQRNLKILPESIKSL
ncbi:uncharacterized protein LOC135292143 [Passer domesticus]|uniref:uncharacterized protein LOC135292143 n=1 Tax=Passer domesticus TaxID=48849 RepID=UPI0030FE0A4C